MAGTSSIRFPKQWSRHIKSVVIHAISLVSVAISYAHGRATGRHRLRAQPEQATAEITLLREELSIKDGRWQRSDSRRRPHYTPTQRMRILQLRAARGWTLEKTARVSLVDLQVLLIWMRRLDDHGHRALIQTVEPATRDLFLAQRFTRHASPLTTTIYTHPSDDEMSNRLRGLER